MPYLSPPTLTQAEQKALLQATAANARERLIFSLALGTGLRLGEIIGLNVRCAAVPGYVQHSIPRSLSYISWSDGWRANRWARKRSCVARYTWLTAECLKQ